MRSAPQADEVKRLQRCINDLVVVQALPALWTGREPSYIATMLLDVMVQMLRLDCAYFRLSDPVEGSQSEWARSYDRRDIDPASISRPLNRWLNDDSADGTRTIRNPLGRGNLAAALFRLGVQGEIGQFVAGSTRLDFPTAVERLLLQAAANEALIALREARLAQQQRRATEELERRVEDLAGRVIAKQEAERQRIARELHDDLAQKIALVNMEIDQLAAKGLPETVRARFHILSGWIREIALDLHNLSHDLHPSKLQALGLPRALNALCHDISRQGRVHVTFAHDDLPQPVDPHVSLCLYRITQEALHNVSRHSQARDAQVHLTSADDRHLALQIADSGVGFDARARHSGMGLVNMRERVEFLGGDLSIDAVPGSGTRISVRVPLAQDTAEPL